MFITLGLNVQKHLNRLQNCICVGPLVISPLKAVLSFIQVITGLAIAIFFSIGFLANGCTNSGLGMALTGLQDALFGWLHLVYSILNIITLGGASCLGEGARSLFCCLNIP